MASKPPAAIGDQDPTELKVGLITAWNDGMAGQSRPLAAPPAARIQRGDALSSAPEALYSGKIRMASPP